MNWIRMIGVVILAGAIGCENRPQASRSTPSAPRETSDSKAVPSPNQAARNEARSNAAPARIEKLQARHLPNPVRVRERVISGGLPEGDAAFAELKELGIKTVISVDGARPDVDTAKKYGMRYVHLPHGYDGVPEERAKDLAKAVRDLPGPIYLHCHHGKHRSPAAAAVACVGAGLIGHDAAATVLRVAGTSEAYRGLYQSTDKAQAFDKALLDELNSEFPAIAKLPEMAEAMVAIEQIHDRLKAIEKAGWKTPDDQPDLVPAHEALLLREQFTEFLRLKELETEPDVFRRLAKEAESAGRALEDALNSSAGPETASNLFQVVNNNCKTCHQTFRDVPLDSKNGKWCGDAQ